jgi:hypothetical protein
MTHSIESLADQVPEPWGARLEIMLRELGGMIWIQRYRDRIAAADHLGAVPYLATAQRTPTSLRGGLRRLPLGRICLVVALSRHAIPPRHRGTRGSASIVESGRHSRSDGRTSCAAYHFPSNSWWAALLPIRGELIDLVLVFFWNFSRSRKATGIDDSAIDFGFTDLDSGCATQDQTPITSNATG